jgi:hypothetical protein
MHMVVDLAAAMRDAGATGPGGAVPHRWQAGGWDRCVFQQPHAPNLSGRQVL